MSRHRTVAVIGGVMAGLAAVEGFHDAGFDVDLYERQPYTSKRISVGVNDGYATAHNAGDATVTDDHGYGHSTVMLVCCAMKALLVGTFVVGGGTGRFALSTGQWLLIVGGLLLVPVGASFTRDTAEAVPAACPESSPTDHIITSNADYEITTTL